jgi:hypothetical protein
MPPMAGAVVIVIALVIALPIAFFVSGGVIAAVMGAALKINGEKTHEGSELIATNK